jgi:hypothetical protein
MKECLTDTQIINDGPTHYNHVPEALSTDQRNVHDDRRINAISLPPNSMI